MSRLSVLAVVIIALGLLLSGHVAESIFSEEIATQDDLWRLSFR